MKLTGELSELNNWAVLATKREADFDRAHVMDSQALASINPQSGPTRLSMIEGARAFDSFLVRDGFLSREEKDRLNRVRSLVCKIPDLIAANPTRTRWKYDNSISWKEQVNLGWAKSFMEYQWSLSVYRIANETPLRHLQPVRAIFVPFEDRCDRNAPDPSFRNPLGTLLHDADCFTFGSAY